jgi:hypothetical protein
MFSMILTGNGDFWAKSRKEAANCWSRKKRRKKTTANYSVQFLNGFWIFLNRGYKHFSYNFLPHKKYLFWTQHRAQRWRMRERVEHSNNSAHHNSRAKSICKEKEQQKPLTLYGIGLINQIMDFTSFDSKQLSFDSFLSIPRSSS